MTRSPAPRLICGCSDRRSADACSPAKRLPRAISATASAIPALCYAGALLRREHLGAGAGSLERTVIDGAEAVNGADAVLLG